MNLDYITRFEFGRTRGWQVRMENRGLKLSKLFSYRKYGGKRKALRRAIALRDENLPKLLPSKRRKKPR